MSMSYEEPMTCFGYDFWYALNWHLARNLMSKTQSLSKAGVLIYIQYAGFRMVEMRDLAGRGYFIKKYSTAAVHSV